MSEENKTTRDSLIKDLKSDRNRLQKLYRKLELEYDDLCEKYDDLQNAFEESCEHRQLLFTRYADTYSEGFRNGQKDCQIKAKKILDTFDKWEADELVDVFGVSTNIELLNDIKANYEKIIAYEKKKEEIHVGDIVVDKIGKKYVVRLLEGDLIYVWASSGESYVFVYSDISKTGKHYPIDEILKELE
jgi:hypothetical protein